MAEETKIEIPEAPEVAGFPADKKREWKQTYAKAFAQALIDHPEDPIAQRQAALREANRIFRVPEPRNHGEAMKLENWQVIHRQETNGQLKVVTIDGKKYSFPAPAAQKARE